MAARISDDWQQMYGHPVYFLETFVDPETIPRHLLPSGELGVAGQELPGRGKQSNSYVPNRSLKQVLGYPLTKQFRQQLGE